MNYNNILYSQQERIVIITINRPRNLNALNAETIQELHEAFKEANLNTELRKELKMSPILYNKL